MGLGDGGQCKTREASRLSRAVKVVARGRPSAQASLPGVATYKCLVWVETPALHPSSLIFVLEASLYWKAIVRCDLVELKP